MHVVDYLIAVFFLSVYVDSLNFNNRFAYVFVFIINTTYLMPIAVIKFAHVYILDQYEFTIATYIM